jgi:hypothetical protein
MTTKKIYRYLGKNGVVDTPILLEGINYTLRIRLIADFNKILVHKNGYKTKVIDILEEEMNDWYEIDDIGQE